MRTFLKYLAYLVLALGVFSANAGSYDDFFVAIKRDNPRSIQELLRRGFDPNTLDPSGRHGLFIALQDGTLDAAQALVDWPKTNVDWRSAKDESPLMIAALRGHTELVRKLIARDADVNKTGWTPLHYAATSGHLQIMALLLEHHAYIDAESPNKTTPLMMAAYYATPEAVKLLLDEGADASLRNELGLTALDFAQKGGRKDAAALIAAAVRGSKPRGKW
jgi:ankyrin repeat protein